MPTVGVGIDGAGGTLVVEGDVAAGDRRAERAAGVGDAAAGLAELEEHLGLLRVAEVEAVGDAERPRAGAGDVARRLGHGGLAALVGIERDEPGVAVHASPRARSRCPGPGARRRRRRGRSTVEACTVESYCSYTQRLLAMFGRVEQELQRALEIDHSAVAAVRRYGGARPRRSHGPPDGRSGSRRPAAGPGSRRR